MYKNRTFYGEYSLEHWIRLILTKNVVLPEYQRYFVWDEVKTKALVTAFQQNQFIPPVTIGAYTNFSSEDSERSEKLNLIIDGQQRLTSILLSYLNIFPTEMNSDIDIGFANEHDDPPLDDDEANDSIIDWNFNRLLQKGDTRKSILDKIDERHYKSLQLDLDESFFKKNYLGFSYLVPTSDSDMAKEQQKFYSTVFRNINIQGVTLIPQESRAALYFLDEGLKNYFDPNFVNKIRIQEIKIDFARYLALMAQFHQGNDSNKLARGYARRMERYYEDFVYSAVGENRSDIFASLHDIRDLPERFKTLEDTLSALEITQPKGPTNYSSIIDADIRLFGLIEIVIFEGESIDISQKSNLIQDLTDCINNIRTGDYLHTRNPGRLKYLRDRAEKSIEIYRSYQR